VTGIALIKLAIGLIGNHPNKREYKEAITE